MRYGDCLCTCHGPKYDVWDGWCDDCAAPHEADLRQVACEELRDLWSDMAEAARNAINTDWSIQMGNLASRIVMLSRHVGAAPWEHISVRLLRSGTYQRVYETAGLTYPEIDWSAVERTEAQIAATLRS